MSRLADLSEQTVEIDSEFEIEYLIERNTFDETEMHLILRADRETGRQRVGLCLVLHLQSKSEIAQRHADAEGAGGADAKLAAQIDRVRSTGAGRKSAAITATVDAKLDEFVAQTKHN